MNHNLGTLMRTQDIMKIEKPSLWARHGVTSIMPPPFTFLELKWKDKPSFCKCQCAALTIAHAGGDHQRGAGPECSPCLLRPAKRTPFRLQRLGRSESTRIRGARERKKKKKRNKSVKRLLTKARSCACEMRTGSGGEGAAGSTLKKAASGPFFS